MLAGIQRATVVIVGLQLLVFCLFGLANDYVLYRGPYEACCVVCSGFVGWLLWRIWHTDMLNDRVTMLGVAAKLDLVALLMVSAYAVLKGNHTYDAVATGSVSFVARVTDQSWVTLVLAGVCAIVLLQVTRLWASCPPPADESDCMNPVSVAHIVLLQKWNLAGAVLGMFGPPVTLPCLAACVLAGSTIWNPLPTGSNETRALDIFYRVKGKQDRFDLEY